MAGLCAGRGGVILIILVIEAISGSSSQTQLSLSDLDPQLSTLASEKVELQKKVEELQKENNSDKARIVQLEKRVSRLKAVSGSTETPPPVPGTILLVGGRSDSGRRSSSVFGVSDCPVPPLPLLIISHDSVTTNDISIFCGGVTGGSGSDTSESALCYMLNGRSWAVHSSMTEARYDHSMVSVPKGIYSFGGHGSESESSSDFLPAGSDTWSVGPLIPSSGVWRSCAVAVNSSHIVIAGGGYDNTQVLLYDFITGEWSTWPSLPYPMTRHACIRTQGGVLLSGGYGGGSIGRTRSVLLDLTSGQPEIVGPLAVGRRGHRMMEYGGAVLAVGGQDGNRVKIGVIEEWVPGTKSWVTKDFSLTEPRSFFAVMNVPLPTSVFCA